MNQIRWKIPLRSARVGAAASGRRLLTAALLAAIFAALSSILFPAASGLFPAASGAETSTRVLTLFTERKDIPAALFFDRSFQATLTSSSGVPAQIDYYSEFLDLSRFPDPQYRRQLFDFYRQKYAHIKFDLILVIAGISLHDLLKDAESVFPGIPIVFASLDWTSIEGQNLGSNVTGIIGKIKSGMILDVALRLQPDTRRVVVVGGASAADQLLIAQARRDFRGYENKVEFTYLSGLPMKELLAAVSKLPEQTIIYYAAVLRDGAGETFVSADAVSLIAQAANAPVYGIADTYLGRGIIGGHLVSFEAMGVRSAEIGLRVLRGEKPAEIPVTDAGTDVDMFDWRQLQRWGISEKNLPPGSIIRYKELSAWDQYKWRIIGITALSIIEALLIGVLVFQRRWLRQMGQSLEERLHFETLLSELSAAFVKLEADDLDREIETWLKRLIEFLEIDRSSIGEFMPDGRQFYVTHSSATPGTQPFPKGLVNDRLPWCAEQLRQGNPIRVSHLPEDLPKEAEAERQYFLQNDLKSYLAIPLFVGGLRIGGMTFAQCRSSRVWPDELVSQLLTVGEIFANALARKRSKDSLQQAMSDIAQLKDRLQAENVYLQEEIKHNHNFDEIVGNSNELKYVLYKIEQVAATDTTVLLLGETGTGKELVARALHHTSTRKDRPLVKVNCAALPANLIESELFGHEKGAFTGAQARKLGRFELASGGTLFLDEIGELPLELQSKLLRALQEGELERVGGSQTIKVNVRVIAATNRNLKQEVQNGRFREDLWYRLYVFPITLPPLRERTDDIPLLANFFANKFGKKLGKPIKSMAPATIKALQNYSWPGNIRELANVIERAMINTQGPVLQLADGLEESHENGSSSSDGKSFEELEREILIQRLEKTKWKIEGPQGAAASLGLNPSTLRNRMIKLGIKKPRALI